MSTVVPETPSDPTQVITPVIPDVVPSTSNAKLTPEYILEYLSAERIQIPTINEYINGYDDFDIYMDFDENMYNCDIAITYVFLAYYLMAFGYVLFVFWRDF